MAQCTDAVDIFTETWPSACVSENVCFLGWALRERTKVLAVPACRCVLLSVAFMDNSCDLSCIPSAGAPSISLERLKHTAWRQYYKGQHAV